MTITTTTWVCIDCAVLHNNGEISDPAPEHAPLSLLGPGETLTAGMDKREHSCDYEIDWQNGTCDCETKEISSADCDTCGNELDGTRYAMTLWID